MTEKWGLGPRGPVAQGPGARGRWVGPGQHGHLRAHPRLFTSCPGLARAGGAPGPDPARSEPVGPRRPQRQPPTEGQARAGGGERGGGSAYFCPKIDFI